MKNYTSMQYLQIDLANHFGLDKLQFEERIDWVNTHEYLLEDWLPEANDKFRYIASLMAYRDSQKAIPTGYLVGLDAAASGIAILGALTGCEQTAHNTGITGSYRRDIYTECTVIMSDLLGTSIKNVDKKLVKKALMTNYYGSKIQPKIAFGEDTPELAAFYQAAQIVAPGAAALKEILLQCWQPDALLHSWIMPDGFKVKLPVLQTMETKLEIDELDHTSLKIMYEDNVGTEKGLSLIANFTHSCDSLMVREVGRRCNYDKQQLQNISNIIKESLSDFKDTSDSKYYPCSICTQPAIETLWNTTDILSLVGIEYITEDNIQNFSKQYCTALLQLIEHTLTKPSFNILFIHDEYLCHPNYMNYVRQTVIDILAEMADSNLVSNILYQITGTSMAVPILSTDLGNDIRKSEYIIS